MNPIGTGRPLIIKEIDLFLGAVPVSCRFSFGSPSQFDFVLLRLGAGSHVGWGETLIPFDDVFIENCAKFLGQDARRLDVLIDEHGTDQPDIRLEAFSIALHDLLGQATGKPLHTLLGGRRRKRIPLMPCIFPHSPDHAGRQAMEFVRQGAKHLKVKLVGNVNEDLQTVRSIRRSVGYKIPLQGDANEGYSLETLLDDVLTNLKSAGLDIIEDPCAGSPEQYAQLCRPSHPLIMVDVLARSDRLLTQVLVGKGAQIVNLHPCQQGSLTHARIRARLCQKYGVPEVVGGTGYLGIGTAAYQHLAGVIGLSGPCGESGGDVDHGMPSLCERLPIRDGCVELPDAPGHGARPKLELLRSFVCREHRIR